MQIIKYFKDFKSLLKLRSIKKYDWIFIIVFITAALVRCYEITMPYCKKWEMGYQEIIARNHYFYGFQQTHFLSVLSVIDGKNIYHLSHPPLLQILIAFSYSLFGIHEWSARIVPIAFSLGSIIIIYFIVQMLFNKEIALLTSIFASFMPMSSYFGQIVNFEAVVLFFVLFVIWSYIQWLNTSNKWYYFFTTLGVILGGLVDWSFFLILPFLLVISILTRDKILSTIYLLILGSSIAGGYLYYRSLIAGSAWGIGDLLTRISHRSNISSLILNEKFYSVLTNRIWNNFTLPLLFLSILGLVLSLNGKIPLRGLFKKPLDISLLIPFFLLLYGLLYIVLFLQSTFIHEWHMYFLIPGMSIYAAIGLNKLIHRNQGNRYIITGCKILAIILLLMFLVLSITTLMGYHQHKYWSAQKIGLLIESRSDPGDNIYLIQIANPIIYYSNRTNSWNPLATVRIEDIEKYHPLFIGYIESETIDSAWNRSNLIEYLYEQHYSALRVQDGIRVWAKSVDTIPLLYRNIQSIEFYNFSSYEKIEPKNEYKSFAIKYSENGNITLLQHPITDGIVVINYAVTVPANVSLIFGAGLDEKIWEKSDGVTFEIYLNASGNHSKLFSKHIDPKTNISDRKWQEFIIPLNEYAGEEIILGFATSPGPKRNVNYDWAYWINPEIVEQQ